MPSTTFTSVVSQVLQTKATSSFERTPSLGQTNTGALCLYWGFIPRKYRNYFELTQVWIVDTGRCITILADGENCKKSNESGNSCCRLWYSFPATNQSDAQRN